MLTDPIADLLTRIRNASTSYKRGVTIPYSREKYAISQILEHNGFIESVKVEKSNRFPELQVTLKGIIRNEKLSLKRISKPGQRIYIKSSDIRKVRNGLGISILSTSQGIMTGEEARRKKIGGEFLCEVYNG